MSRVRHFGADRTNQKLYFAKLAYQDIAKAENPQQAQMSRESAVFHLYGAYGAFLQELNGFYALGLSRPTLESIKLAFERKALVSPEVAVLENGTWSAMLTELTAAFHACMHTPKRAVANQYDMSDSSKLIVKTTQSTLSWLPTEALIAEWLDAMSACIQHCRSTMLEM